MFLQDKYKRNEKWAEILYHKEEYSISVSRYYYSVYQRILKYNKNKEIKFDEEDLKEKGHLKTIKAFSKNFIFPVDMNKKERKNFRETILELKELREKADYGDEHISKQEMEDFLEKFRDIVHIIDNQ